MEATTCGLTIREAISSLFSVLLASGYVFIEHLLGSVEVTHTHTEREREFLLPSRFQSCVKHVDTEEASEYCECHKSGAGDLERTLLSSQQGPTLGPVPHKPLFVQNQKQVPRC